MRTTKKIFTAFLTLLMLTAFSVPSFASAAEIEDDAMRTDAGYGLSFEEPIEKVTRDGQIPTSIWNLSTKGRYNFEGTSDGSKLYTLFRFNGARKYKICVFNESSSAVTVKPKRETWTYISQTVPGKESAIFYFDVGSTSTSFYIYFENAHAVSGYIEVA